ncbi:hypothetical protein CEUSTIGMA_g10242.t1 [Chlamydomonas eustigma]|uniref:Uridine kinase n=1 Tax=Chlamydomonas eustigma TaxID=1157962 RepID=A0A250XII0_9CHLO|nr:hypothetical protein CEUSTIGMA_g10242.t1 [Chlamydomonas eustigma]|eukprot:GAX82816.1 hypothetical protein CEUSTIGMA_g10242.t1 [Chlamydomonas eustigma]
MACILSDSAAPVSEISLKDLEGFYETDLRKEPDPAGSPDVFDNQEIALECMTPPHQMIQGFSPSASPSGRMNFSHLSLSPPKSISGLSRTRGAAPFIIGVTGGTASGKTTFCDMVAQKLNDSCVVMLSQDSFYRNLTAEEKQQAAAKNYNFDHPDAFDVTLMMRCLEELKNGRAVDVPCYDFSTHARDPLNSRRVEPADVVIIEGILVLHMAEIRKMLSMKVFVDTDDDVRLARRIQRDVTCRGRDVAGVIEQYTRFVKPAFDQFIAPSRKVADLIIPWHGSSNNMVAIDLITEHIKTKLQQHEMRRFYPNLEVIPSNFQTRGMHTIIRNKDTSKNDFVFYADRLIRLVVEAGLGFLPFVERTVVTPSGRQYVGVDFARKLCGVSVIRSGESMENALRACCQGIKLGKILVHRNDAGDVTYQKLPADIASRHVLLMDPILSTGHVTIKVIEALLKEGVQENKILFLCIIAAPEGIRRVFDKFPTLKIVTSEIESHVEDEYTVIPGVGNFGDRYFCD